ncbi:40S ribosomal protein mrp2, mitochondrial [Orbilia oligospora]|uniref:40S ribosomal protein mrp2, mitochondrial n=1 Tax=Orbilia oligospora TaxID=2813651 RepID=A0A4Z0XNQ0_ORBOL|nr:40S ribosomal protein mrp2, mitochondrial [Orbilia oligospora]KAF3098711.1 40S ribosomal protein mrp2, mitochondrial [Orbilia oligospora]KAF3117193.1 40S ribosomal protein mrp2, mitochondrial [Orbilia oligospora]KAF3138347.1 40S ribosomal protein mrp2, mitochondrial [Orbilia oligospora]KAF3151251.1 40S ribosomal protein mrp2, mitochondrial [Orbilia oligospora]
MSPLKGHFLSAGKPTHKLACFIQSRIFRDAYKREQFAKYEVERRALRFIIASNQFNARQKTEAQLQLTQLPVSSQPTKIKNRCTVGGRGRSVFREFKMGRFPFRLAALAGDLPGVKKASW